MPREAKVTASLNAKDKSAGAFSSVRQRFNKLKATFDRGFDLGKKFMIGGAVAGVALGVLVKRAMDAGDKFDKMRQRIGVSAQFLSKLDYAADRSGTKLENMEKSLVKMTRAVIDAQNGSKNAQWAIGQLGVRIYDTSGKLKDNETLFTEFVAALAKMEDGAKKNAVAMTLFGKSGNELIPLAGGMRQLMEQGGRLGFVWTNDTAAAAATLKDRIDDLHTITGGLANRFASRLFPVLTKIAARMGEWYEKNKELIDSNVEKWADRLGGAIESIGGWIQTAIDWWAKFIDGLGASSAIDKFVQGVQAQVQKIWDFWTPLVLDMTNSVMGVVGTSWDGILRGVNEAIDRMQPVIDTIEKYVAPQQPDKNLKNIGKNIAMGSASQSQAQQSEFYGAAAGDAMASIIGVIVDLFASKQTDITKQTTNRIQSAADAQQTVMARTLALGKY